MRVRQLPSGTVTLFFTDIEGSTRLLHELGERYAEVLAEHRRLLREAFLRHGGIEVDTQGDAFFVAFARAGDAVAAAREAQDALAEGSVRVRMGLHTGEPVVTEEGYVGADVHRAARIMGAGHGGQVLLSETTARLLDSSAELRDLGEHRLKDLSGPQRLYQLGDSDFPPLRTLYQTNLPIQPSPLVGRERELAEAGALVRSHRLLTLTGPGGSGKTRLALQLAAEAVEQFPDGVFWVPLQALRDPTLVERAIGTAVGADDGLIEYVGNKRLLVLLDNFEQVVEAAPNVAALLAGTPHATVLVTSREPLQIESEQRYPVEPLPADAAALLLLERARAVAPAFRPTAAVGEICQRLDGLPLAIELAAARVALLEPEELLARLEQRLPLLASRSRDARPGSGRCAPRSNGVTSCSSPRSRSSSAASRSSEEASRSRRRRPSATPISTLSSRSSSRTWSAAGAAADWGCSTRSASTHSSGSTSRPKARLSTDGTPSSFSRSRRARTSTRPCRGGR